MLELKITNEQKIEVKLNPVSQGGKPVQLDGKPDWTVLSGDATVEPSEDGLSAFLVSGDNPGDTQVLVEADADLGEGKVTVSDTIKLTVEGALAENLGLSAGEPVQK